MIIEGYNVALAGIQKAKEEQATRLDLSGLGLAALPPMRRHIQP
jgi:hypothetical protein